MKELHIIKIGGNVLKDELTLSRTISDIAQLKQPLLMVHGGGKHVDQWMQRIGAEVKMVDGRRITDAVSLELAVMNYAGLINKHLVALFESQNRLALGMSGADLHCIRSVKRNHPTIDYGFVGDVVEINDEAFDWLIQKNIIPVCCAITADRSGQLLNTNADTIAAEIAIAMSKRYKVSLWYCFEKKGVLRNVADENSLVEKLDARLYAEMLAQNLIHTGMKPKLENCFNALTKGVQQIFITDSNGIKNIPHPSGTQITRS
ncbi:MAG: acetylglutamate kinase [Saprospiraceae bacterium]|nr:acetylglutamate kinase [Saprospiraceae bacterium]